MSQSTTNKDREFSKFVDSPTRANQSAVEVTGIISVNAPNFGIPSATNAYTYTESTDGIYFTEIYRFYSGGTPIAPIGLLKTITIYYSDSARKLEVGGAAT